MNSVALRYFHEVARAGSIAAACQRLNVAGSAVSRQIAALEYEVGAQLFDRQPRGMVLTEAGRLLAQHVRLSLLEEERVLADIRSNGTRNIGTIKVATSQGLASNFVPEAARIYRQRFNDVRFDIRALGPTDIIAAVTAGEADLGIAYALGNHPGVIVRHRAITPTFVILAPKHQLGRRKLIRLEELDGLPVATSRDSTLRGMVSRRAAVLGVHFDIVYESDYSDGLFNYCASGEALAFASRFSAARWMARGELRAVPLADAELFERSIEVQTMAGRTLPGYVEDWIRFLLGRLPADEKPVIPAQRRADGA